MPSNSVKAPVMSPGSIRPDGLGLHYVTAEFVQYRGKSALRIVDAAPGHGDDVSRIAVVKNTSLLDGTIEINLSGDTVPDASQDSRGFVGIAFRAMADVSRYECFYLRPKNGRPEDQLPHLCRVPHEGRLHPPGLPPLRLHQIPNHHVRPLLLRVGKGQ